jgi:hypothetical protein
VNNGIKQVNRFGFALAVVASLGSAEAFADADKGSSAEIKHERNEIWVSHTFDYRATCEVYIDGELVVRQKKVPRWVPFVYQHDSSLADVASWEGICEVPPNVGISGKAVDYSKEAASANYDREREEYLVGQGSTRSEKFSVHESAQPKTRSSVIVDSGAASQKTYSARSQNGAGTITYGGSFRRSASSAGRGMSNTEREQAMKNALERYNQKLQAGEIPETESLAGADFEAEREAYLAKKRK